VVHSGPTALLFLPAPASCPSISTHKKYLALVLVLLTPPGSRGMCSASAVDHDRAGWIVSPNILSNKSAKKSLAWAEQLVRSRQSAGEETEGSSERRER
jgi:hypothetical protein